MTTYYKLTDKNGKTHGGMQWGEGVRHEATGRGKELCSDGWIHCYDDPLLAVLLNPIGGQFGPDMRLWKFEVEGAVQNDCGLKYGCKVGTTGQEIPVPVVTTAQAIRFGILCAMIVYGRKSAQWDKWANNWLTGKDRSRASAASADDDAADDAAARAAADAAAYNAAVHAGAAAHAAAHAGDDTQRLDLKALAAQAIREEV